MDSWPSCVGGRRQSCCARNQHHQRLDSAPLNLFSFFFQQMLAGWQAGWLAGCCCPDLFEFLILSMIPTELRTCYRLQVYFRAKSSFLLGLALIVTEPLPAPRGHPGKGHSLGIHQTPQHKCKSSKLLASRERSALIAPASAKTPVYAGRCHWALESPASLREASSGQRLAHTW